MQHTHKVIGTNEQVTHSHAGWMGDHSHGPNGNVKPPYHFGDTPSDAPKGSLGNNG